MIHNSRTIRMAAGLLAAVLPAICLAQAQAYDPLKVADEFTPKTLDLTFTDTQRKRDIPLRIYLPADDSPAPVVLFSHGLGGSRENNPYLGNHWSARGYVAVFVQHAGSDEAVWKDAEPQQRLQALQKAASLGNFLLRAKDIPAVLDRLEAWNADEAHPLHGRLDPARIGMSGHSFGAITTQAVSGQHFFGNKPRYTDPRIKAALALSPSGPSLLSPREAFGSVRIPWMLMTGTKDLAFVGNIDMESRLAVFPALPPGGKYELVLFNAEHSAFADRALPGDVEPRNPNHHRVVLALSTAFWDAWLKQDPAARAWLDGDGPKALLEENDRWQKK